MEKLFKKIQKYKDSIDGLSSASCQTLTRQPLWPKM